jgi:glycosyltransferase involved in cell wall biosynthesis
MQPLVSILIPAFNAEEWISESIDSAIRQTWARKEVIVVDDGSTDSTARVARGFASRNVVVVSTANQGPAAARNHALELCQGDYIQWLDADDVLAADKIERQIEVGADSRTVLSGSWGTFYYRARRAQFSPSSLWQDLPPIEWLLRNIGGNVFMPPMTWLTSRRLADAAGPWNAGLRMDEDAEYFCRVLLHSDGIRFVNAAKSYYRMVPAGVRNSVIGHSTAKKSSKLQSMRLHIKYLHSLEVSERVRWACAAYLQTWLEVFFPEHPDAVEELYKLAEECQRELSAPRLRPKYQWLVPVLGYRAAKGVQGALPEVRHRLARTVDRLKWRFGPDGQTRSRRASA